LSFLSLAIALSRVRPEADREAGLDTAQAAAQELKPAPAAPKLGLVVNRPEASPGYTLLASANSTKTYLIDMQGRVVRSWKSDCNPGLSAYLLENGNLLRTGQIRNPPFFGGGTGGRIQEFTWDGELVWDFTYFSETQLPNHDVCKLPNGNVLMIVWVKKSAQQAVAAGRRPETVGETYLLAGSVLEVQPTGKTTGKIVWEWHSWDHLAQDFDATKANYGDVASHPERIDLNFGEATIAAMVAQPKELAKLRALGYVGGAVKKPQSVQPDWLHINGVAYNADLDQIMLSVYEFSEIWVIDHSTTTAEAASHGGGRYRKGGDLLYRWGNPRAYRAGTAKDQRLFGQHDAHWIAKGLPGEGHVLIFNNGIRRIGGAYSTVDEIVLPVDARGRYAHARGKAYGPDKPIWTYIAPNRSDFYAPFISGAQRQPNGNTLICSGTNGTVFEVTPQNEIVWKYVNPVKMAPPPGVFPFGAPPVGGPPGTPPPVGGPPGNAPPAGAPPFGGPPKLGQILPSFLQGVLTFSAEQKTKLGTVEDGLGAKLAKILTDEQQKQFTERPIDFGPGGLPLPGQLLASSVRDRLKLTEQQKTHLAEVQKEADGRLDAILKDEQKKLFRQMQDMAKAFAAGMPGGPPDGFPAGPPGAPPGGIPGGPPGGFPGGPPGGFATFGGDGLFRAPRYAPDFPGLAGKDLTPGKTVEEVEAADSPPNPWDERKDDPQRLNLKRND
jgi:hypothetical protein